MDFSELVSDQTPTMTPLPVESSPTRSSSPTSRSILAKLGRHTGACESFLLCKRWQKVFFVSVSMIVLLLYVDEVKSVVGLLLQRMENSDLLQRRYRLSIYFLISSAVMASISCVWNFVYGPLFRSIHWLPQRGVS